MVCQPRGPLRLAQPPRPGRAKQRRQQDSSQLRERRNLGGALLLLDGPQVDRRTYDPWEAALVRRRRVRNRRVARVDRRAAREQGMGPRRTSVVRERTQERIDANDGMGSKNCKSFRPLPA